MRLFYFLALLIPFSLYAQIDVGNSNAVCDENDITFGGDIQCGSLTINVTPVWDPTVVAVDIRVNGDVIINAPLDLNGGDSQDGGGNFDNFFGVGGPGAGDGGSTNSGFPQAAPGVSGGGFGTDGACGAGGGGGGYGVAAPLPGANCSGAGGAAGAAFSNFFVDNFRGGFGGGSGGNGTATLAGGGGGGGGAIRIRAKGNITINFNVTANGGVGGDSTGDGGGGGGGSGGLIWFQALGNITNNANVTTDGGAGGDGDGTGGADGSTGGRGVIRFEDLDGIIAGNPLPGYAITGIVASGGSSSLKSSIACGLINKDQDDHGQFFQMILGFSMIVALLHFMRKFRILFPRLR